MEVASKYHATSEKMLDEKKEVEAAKKDPARFEPLYDRYHEQIFRYIYQRLDNKDLAFDTVQQVFMKAMTNLNKYEFRGVPFGSWLYRIAYSEINQLFRDQKAQRMVNMESVQINEMMDEIDENKSQEHQDRLINILSQLAEQDLQLIEMRFFEQRPFKEMAEILGITENNAKVRTYRVLDKLKTIFKK